MGTQICRKTDTVEAEQTYRNMNMGHIVKAASSAWQHWLTIATAAAAAVAAIAAASGFQRVIKDLRSQ